MDLKQALAVCVICLFSATLVLLIARALDNQAATRLEPRLEQIVEELRALRQGGDSLAPREATPVPSGLVVYYFHGTVRCPTCRSIEAQTYRVLTDTFAEALDRGSITWRVVNYEQDSASALRARFDVKTAVVVLARVDQGQIQDWRRLDEVWALWDDPPEFAALIERSVREMLAGQSKSPADHS